jgi:diacylglycerol kinase (ATP)
MIIMMKKVLVVFNPTAGQQDADQTRSAIEDHFQRASWNSEFYVTTGEDKDREAIMKAAQGDYDYIIAAGGDGTVAETAGCLVENDIPLGILPTGTGNGIARALAIPLVLDEALTAITNERHLSDLDAMKLGERYFFLLIGVGLSATALKESSRDQKDILGRLYYFFLGLKAYFGFHPHRFQMIIDGDKAVRARGAEILLLNCGTVGDPILRWEDEITADDGEIQVYILRARTVYDYFRFFWNAMARRESRDPSVLAFRMRTNAHIQSKKPLPVQGDGDFIQHTPVEISVVPKAIKVVTP